MTEKTEQNVEHLHGLKTAIWLYWKLVEKSDSKIIEVFDQVNEINEINKIPKFHLIDLIMHGLDGFSFSLKHSLPSKLQKLGLPRICLIKRNGEVAAQWLGSDPGFSITNVNSSVSFSLELALLSQLGLSTGTKVTDSVAKLIAETFLQEMFESEVNGITVPGFRRISAKEKSTMVVLEFIPSVIKKTNFETHMPPTRMY